MERGTEQAAQDEPDEQADVQFHRGAASGHASASTGSRLAVSDLGRRGPGNIDTTTVPYTSARTEHGSM